MLYEPRIPELSSHYFGSPAKLKFYLEFISQAQTTNKWRGTMLAPNSEAMNQMLELLRVLGFKINGSVARYRNGSEIDVLPTATP